MAEYIQTGGTADIFRGQVTQNPGSAGRTGGGLKAPESIIRTVAGAKVIYERLRAGSLKRMHQMAQIDGIIAGEPPYDPEELAAAKLDYIANVNMLDGRSLYEKAAQAYWNLKYQAQRIATVRYVSGSANPTDDLKAEEILSKHYHDILMEWDSFTVLESIHDSNIVKYGLSVLIWPDERSWKFRVVDPYMFYIPDQAESDIEQMTVMCVETNMSIQTLFDLWETLHDKEKDASPWNVDELEHLIIRLANSPDKKSHNLLNINEIRRRWYNGDTSLGNILSDEVQLVSLYQMEYNKKISHNMFHPQYNNGDFLYRLTGQYNSFNDCILVCSASAGEKTIHANRGTGHKIYTSSQAIMRLDNSILDIARIASTPILSGSATGPQDLQQIRFYPGVPTLIGSATLQQNNFGTTIQQIVGASQFFTGKQNFNLGNSGDDPSQPDKSSASMSAEQFKFTSIDEFSIQRHVIYHYYRGKDRQHQNIVSKMLQAKKGDPDFEYAQEWKERCIASGIPDAIFKSLRKSKVGVLPRNWRVKATRVIGDGSAVAAIINMQKFRELVPGLSAEGVENFNRTAGIATVGPDHVDAFVVTDSGDASGQGASLAGLENIAMKAGESPVFSPDNQHRAHFATHMALNMWVIQQLEQQLQQPDTGQTMDPVAADKIFAQSIPHTQEHFEAEAQSGPFGEVWANQNKKNFMQVMKFAQENKLRAEEILSAELKKRNKDTEATQQVMGDAQRKDFVAQKDVERKDMQVLAKEQRTAEAQQVRAQTMRDKVILDHSNKQLDVVLKNKLEAQKASAEQLRENISKMNGKTPATADIEKPSNT